jgi:ATP-dependent Clp protease ATP-binding subunit ClpC
LANGIREIDDTARANNPINKAKKKVASLMPNGNKNDKTEEKSEAEEIEYVLPPCPASLMGARLVNVELAGLVAGTSNRGDFERKIKNLVKEASENNVILFIDEIHNLIGTGGGGDGAMNAANILKPALARGELRLLGATTTPEYRRYIEKDGALERRFQPLEVKEPTVYETLDILGAVSPKYEEFHGVEYTYNALMAATKLSDRYVNDRFLPDKAIDIIDEAGSMVKMREEGERFYVTEDAIEEVVAEITGIPVGKLDNGEKARLKNIEKELEKRIKGQSPAVRSVAKAIRRARSGMRDGKRPVASLLFCGSTGVGKVRRCTEIGCVCHPKHLQYFFSSVSDGTLQSTRRNILWPRERHDSN